MRWVDPGDLRTRRPSLMARGAAVADEANRIVQQLAAQLGDPHGEMSDGSGTSITRVR
jgi:hypothetical protein